MPPQIVEPGSRFADRFRLEERIETVGVCATWRAVDEKLSRPVSIYLLPHGEACACGVAEAARAAARLSDPRFTRILDISQENEITYVVLEWFPPPDSVASLLASGPLSSADATDVAREVAAALDAAHQAGLFHLRLSPLHVFHTDGGQTKVSGLMIDAALRKNPPDHDPTAAATTDTRALGALMYAALTARWPGEPTYGLPAAPREAGRLCSPRQIRAGVLPALDEIAMRALGEISAGDSLDTPAAVAKALTAIPRPTPEFSGAPNATTTLSTPSPAPGWRPIPSAAQRWARKLRRSGRIGVAAFVSCGLVLLCWQIVLGLQRNWADDSRPLGQRIPIASVSAFDPLGDLKENNEQLALTTDGKPDTAWQTVSYTQPNLGGLKAGVGLVIDLGSSQRVRSVEVALQGEGTALELRAAPSSAEAAPETLDGYATIAEEPRAGTSVRLIPDRPISTRYLVVWLTSLPRDDTAQEPYRAGIAEISVYR